MLCQDDTGWDLCLSRMPAGGGLYQLAVNVEVAGWTLQRRGPFGSEHIRIQPTYVADPMDIDLYTGER